MFAIVLLIWAALFALGAYLQIGADEPKHDLRKPLIIMGSMTIFLLLWGLALWARAGGKTDAMETYPSDVAFTPAVKAIQTAKGSRDSYARVEGGEGWATTVTDELAAFIAELDMFYFATASADGQPYVQYKGGRPGFLKVVDEHTLGWADFAGNQQYISLGNLSENPKAFIYLMDYIDRRRIKLWGKARVVENDPALDRAAARRRLQAGPRRAGDSVRH